MLAILCVYGHLSKKTNGSLRPREYASCVEGFHGRASHSSLFPVSPMYVEARSDVQILYESDNIFTGSKEKRWGWQKNIVLNVICMLGTADDQGETGQRVAQARGGGGPV